MTATDSWDPVQYHRFQHERRQPFVDLLALLRPTPGGQAVDLGCGTGELTAALHRHLRADHTVGVDRSAAMLAETDAWVEPGLSFIQAEIGAFAHDGDESFDVIAANASLQWVADHLQVVARLRERLTPSGQLAFQVPANSDHPSHAAARQVAAEPPFAAALAAGGSSFQDPVPPPETYAVLLHELGFAEQTVRLQVYGHLLASTADVVEWVKGTLLTPYREALDEAAYAAFLDRYRARLLELLGDRQPYFYPFKRIVCWAALS
ncbi:MAG: methyltransferase domain-containing protein [Acidimicrobiales bacterium]